MANDPMAALMLACKYLEDVLGDCPLGREDISDDFFDQLNCDNCGSNAKRCWRTYFLLKAKEDSKTSDNKEGS